MSVRNMMEKKAAAQKQKAVTFGLTFLMMSKKHASFAGVIKLRKTPATRDGVKEVKRWGLTTSNQSH